MRCIREPKTGAIAPSEELIWFDKSAHLPNSEERDLFNRIMVVRVLPVAAQARTRA